jgi:hypothetical protein
MTVEQPQAMNPSISAVMQPLSDAAGWMKLIGTLAIIWGVILALSIVGLIVAWLPIWMGILLRRAADESVVANRTGHEANAVAATASLHTIFKVQGVILLVMLVLWTVGIVLGIILVVASGGDIEALGAVPFIR